MKIKPKNNKKLIFIDQAIVSGSNFLLGILLARILSIELFGQYALLWMLALFFLSVQQSAIVSPMYSLEPKRKHRSEHHSSSIFIMQFFFALTSTVIVFSLLIILPFFQSKWDVGITIFPFSLAVLVFLIQDFIRRFFFLKEEYHLVILMDIFAYIGLILSLLLFSNFITLNLSVVFLLFFLTFLSSLLLALFNINSTILKMSNVVEISKEYWGFSKWLSLSNILQWLCGNLFIVMGGYLLGAWVVGVVRIFQNTMGLFHIILLALENFVPISAAIIYKENGLESLYKYIYKFVLVGLVTFAMLMAIFALVSPSLLINFIYGESYSDYGYILYFYLVIYLFIYFNTLARFILRTIELTKLIFIAYMYSVFFSISASWMLISYFGIEGMIIGILSTQIIMLLTYYKSITKQKEH